MTRSERSFPLLTNHRMNRILISLFLILSLSFFGTVHCRAQFKKDAFQQSYNNDKTKGKDSTDILFSFKDYFGGLSHKKEIKIGTSFAGSFIFIGGQQIYNKDYWKLPIVYSTTLGALGAGIGLNVSGNHEAAKYCFIGAGVAYWGTLLDGALSYKPAPYPYPGKATILSILCPGLGQAYNHEYWKIPLYVGCLVGAYHFFDYNNAQFQRFRKIYIEATDPEVPYTGPITADQALYYRNIYRSYRDYCIVALAAFYLLQIIDANVFAYMHDFEVKDDLGISISPAVIAPNNQYATSVGQSTAFGLSCGIRF